MDSGSSNDALASVELGKNVLDLKSRYSSMYSDNNEICKCVILGAQTISTRPRRSIIIRQAESLNSFNFI